RPSRRALWWRCTRPPYRPAQAEPPQGAPAMEPLAIGQTVTYYDSTGAAHAAVVLEPYAQAALVHVPDLALNLAVRRLQFEDAAQPYPYLTDADGSSTTEQNYEAPIAEE